MSVKVRIESMGYGYLHGVKFTDEQIDIVGKICDEQKSEVLKKIREWHTKCRKPNLMRV